MKLFCCLTLALSIVLPLQVNSQGELFDLEAVTFNILYNDVSLKDSIIGDQGFSCLVEMPEYAILFDAGRIEDNLRNNAEQMKVSYGDIDSVFISLLHGDQVGGLPGFIEKVKQAKSSIKEL